jgi:Protein of unknown function (DUF938)
MTRIPKAGIPLQRWTQVHAKVLAVLPRRYQVEPSLLMIRLSSPLRTAVVNIVPRRRILVMARLYSPSASRNTQPILKILQGILPDKGLVLELASGTGEHVCAFAQAFPNLTFQPSDVDGPSLESIRLATQEMGLSNVLPPLRIDATDEDWPVSQADAIICINLVHISPFEACEGLMRGSGKVLSPGGYLYLYGAYKFDGQHTSPSNVAFDGYLRSQNPAWGVRDLKEVKQAAQRHGLSFVKCVDMPANNFSVIFQQAQNVNSGETASFHHSLLFKCQHGQRTTLKFFYEEVLRVRPYMNTCPHKTL